MSDKVIENNQVTMIGEIISPFTFSHEVFGEGFYKTKMEARRTSGTADEILVTVSERLLAVSEDYTGKKMKVSGQFRSYNQNGESKKKLILYVFAREAELFEGEPNTFESNHVFLDGYVCKEPVYRITPLGREITDVLLAVNRPYGKSDYIPCICWGRNAGFASEFEVGEHVRFTGRIQSRKYIKKISSSEGEERTAYEVSVSRVETLN